MINKKLFTTLFILSLVICIASMVTSTLLTITTADSRHSFNFMFLSLVMLIIMVILVTNYKEEKGSGK